MVKKIAIFGKKTVKAGKTLKLKAKVTATKKANKKIKWSSSNKKYASVSSSGKVKALKAGKGFRLCSGIPFRKLEIVSLLISIRNS